MTVLICAGGKRYVMEEDHMPNAKPELRIVRRRTVDLDPSAAQLVRDAEPRPVNDHVPSIHSHLWGMLAALAIVVALGFTLLPRAY
jgi:hypothetical protein